MTQEAIKAAFIRGGTSKAVIFRREDLPEEQKDWDPIFLSLMGSPDPNGRQLDGMGGGLSSLSKICVVGRSKRSDADVDYTFAQVGIREATVDYAGNCGNMSSAIGPFAVDEGLVDPPADGTATIRIYNTNTAKIICASFETRNGKAVVAGDFRIDGVAGSGAPIRLEFMDPGGAKTGTLLPTGAARDVLNVPGLGETEVTLLDAANPCVFVPASALGKVGNERPDELDGDALLLERLEAIRSAGSVRMGLAANLVEAHRISSIPQIIMVSAPADMRTTSGERLSARDYSIGVRAISNGQPHRALMITGALCLAVAVRINGTIPHGLATASSGPIRIGHPSGILSVDAEVVGTENPAEARATYGAIYRTSRRLFEGRVLYSLSR
ncbi:PrpF family protein [Rhizobiales bacterium L72]|uniref:PrpF family protein n=1 Tax=Propylenella binzhouense TaxID=2555902 RepID=A0A964T2S6_9HYPH|nr:PrpF family protein [Propylenella binzhouense]